LNAEITEQNQHLPLAKELLNTFFACDYAHFMNALAKLERDFLLNNRYLRPHVQYYTRAMRIKAYQQFLTPYKSVTSFLGISIIFYYCFVCFRSGQPGRDGQKFWGQQGLHGARAVQIHRHRGAHLSNRWMQKCGGNGSVRPEEPSLQEIAPVSAHF
jgi:hypothetical protein